MKTELVAAALIVVVLAGCSSAPNDEQEAGRIAGTSTAQEADAAEETEAPEAAPVTIEPTAAAGNPEYGGFASQDEWYLRSLVGALSGTPSDADLIAAGNLACEQISSGTPATDVRVVTGSGELADQDNRNIVTYAVQVYCP